METCDTLVGASWMHSVHRFALTPQAAGRLGSLAGGSVSTTGTTPAREVLSSMIAGTEPGWVCIKCGLSAMEFLQIAAIIGSERALSALVIKCVERPVMKQYRIAGKDGQILSCGLTRLDAVTAGELRERFTSRLAERGWLVPVLVPAPAGSGILGAIQL